MAEQKKDDSKQNAFEQSNYTFIQETIRPKKRSRIKKVLFTTFLACLFGVLSCVVFCISLPFVAKILKVDRRVISFGAPEETERPLALEMTATPNPSSTVKTTVTPSVTVKPTPTVTPNPTSVVGQIEEPATITDYMSMYNELKMLANQVNKSIVTVTSVKNGVDVFNNPSENTNSTCGIIIANNGKELLLFVNNERIESANYLMVTFLDGTKVDAKLYSLHEELGIAIVAVEINELPHTVLESIAVAEFGDSRSQVAGDPVIALGNPNGYMYSVEYGFVSNAVYSSYFTDCKVDLINTTIPYNANGEGVIVNLEGKVIGFITNQAQFKNDLNQDINTCVGITRLKPIIERLVNRTDLIYFGIVGNDVTSEIAKKIGVENGIYVMEVKAESPAYEAGIKKGDVITHIGDTQTTNMTLFNNIISIYSDKQQVSVTLLRKNGDVDEEMKVNVVLSTVK